ncbi:hypothetical protein PGQ11_015429 [Apiospora arundinis]|uniref:Uncharacterized protein n=1 Tax=Apiospora arundinis TaxID=335852 RepID=A0ABR2HM13_9PEZI
MSTPFTTHVDIQCVYPISGNYGIAPRFLYYCLVFFVALFQRYPKLTAGAAAYCISYAGATVVHAVILAVISGSSTPFLAATSLKMSHPLFGCPAASSTRMWTLLLPWLESAAFRPWF